MENLELVKFVIRIANFLFELPNVRTSDQPYDSRKNWLEDRRDPKQSGGANYYYNRTKSGLFLGYYYGSPSEIWTPWGSWGFVGSLSGPWPIEAQQTLENKLGLKIAVPEFNAESGTFGPAYEITRFGEIELPKAELIHQGVECVMLPTTRERSHDEYVQVTSEWKALFEVASTSL